MSFEIFEYDEVKPLECLGFTSKYWTVHLDTLIFTWVGMTCLLSCCINWTILYSS